MYTDAIRLVSGDSRPVIIVQLWDEIEERPYSIDHGVETVIVRFRAMGTTETLSVIQCTPYGPGEGGKVQFDFSGGALDVPAGAYEGEVVVVRDDEDMFTPYTVLRFRVRNRFEDP